LPNVHEKRISHFEVDHAPYDEEAAGGDSSGLSCNFANNSG